MKLYLVVMVALLLGVTSLHASPIEAQKTLSGALDQLETMEKEIERDAAEAPAGKLKDEKNLEAEFLQGIIQGMQDGGKEREERGFYDEDEDDNVSYKSLLKDAGLSLGKKLWAKWSDKLSD